MGAPHSDLADRRTLRLHEAYVARREGRATRSQLKFLKRAEPRAIRVSLFRHVVRQQAQTPGWSLLMLLRNAQVEFAMLATKADEIGRRVFVPGLGLLSASDCRRIVKVADKLVAEFTVRYPPATDEAIAAIELDERRLIRRDKTDESRGPPRSKTAKGRVCRAASQTSMELKLKSLTTELSLISKVFATRFSGNAFARPQRGRR